MNSARDWLGKMLTARQLLKPDGRMLFGYRLTTSEFLSLQETLRIESGQGLSHHNFLHDKEACALFVMYAAEWWRREYNGGAWRWTPIVDSFAQIPGEVLAATDRTHAVIRGSSYWGHAPGVEGKKYFGVLVSHGGLPMRLIAQGQGKVNAVLSGALRLALKYGWDERSIQSAIEERKAELNQHLWHDEIYSLMTGIVTAVMDLRRQYSLAGLSNPIETLDRKEPSWRERFPLPIDDAVAQQLLAGLVKEASQVNEVSKSEILRTERLLRELSSGKFNLLSYIRHPQLVNSQAIATSFGIDVKELPRYFNIDINVRDREPLCSARQILGSMSSSVRLDGRPLKWHGDDACQEHLMYLRGSVGDLTSSASAIPGGAALSFDVPWTFVDRDGQLVLCRTGSARVQEVFAIVVCSQDFKIELHDSDAETVQLGQCQVGNVILNVTKVVGSVQVIGTADTFRIRTSQAADPPLQFVWEGRRFAYQPPSWPIFVGTPNLAGYSQEGERVSINHSHLHWFAAGRLDQRVENRKSLKGPIEVWLLENGERQLRFRFIVLEPDARIIFTSGNSEREGTICFHAWQDVNASVAGIGLNGVTTRENDDVRVELTSDGPPPQFAHFHLKWAGIPREVRIALPFPATGGRFYGDDGQPLPDKSRLSIWSIAGTRLRVFDHNPQQPKKYKLKLKLLASKEISKDQSLFSDHEVALQPDGTAEVRLLDLATPLQRLMGLSDDLDACVTVTLYVGSLPVSGLQISRYDSALEKDGAIWRIGQEALSKLTVDDLRDVSMCALPIGFSASGVNVVPQLQSEGVPTGSWSVHDLPTGIAPWLLYPSSDSKVMFRPALWVPRLEVVDVGNTKTYTPCPLGQAMATSDTEIRMLQIDAVVDEMSRDFFHKSWELLERNLTALRHLPLSSLDVWRAIARNHFAAVACSFRIGCTDSEMVELVRRLRDELGLVWELTSFEMWSEAAIQVRPYFESLVSADLAKKVVATYLRGRIVLLSGELTALFLPIQMTLLESQLEPTPELIAAMHDAQLAGPGVADKLWRGGDSLAQKYLFRAHSAESAWPKFGLVVAALEVFQSSISPEVLATLRRHATKLFWLPSDAVERKVDVANIPILCALWSAIGASVEWWSAKERALELKQLRAFDPLWFEEAFRQTTLICMVLGLTVKKQ